MVLVVEDEWLLRDSMVQELEGAGYRILEADAAETALDLLQAGYPVDVLVTDIDLGGALSGWDVAEAFRARTEAVTVIYVSGSAGDRSRQVPGSQFIDKPCAGGQVLDAFKRDGPAPSPH